ncbi:hypothetical protein LguiB_028512 [Lonicera macranthoides]
MKFGKEFASQMVPEWQEAYMDYDYLKTLLKEIHNFNLRTKPQQPTPLPKNLKRRPTLYRAFSGLTHHKMSPAQDIEDQAILVNSVQRENGERHETMFLMADDEGGEYELVYFKRLDEEFNKVVKFYKTKVEEVVEEANVLTKQMDALVAFRIKVDDPHAWFDRAVEMTRLASNVAASTAALSVSTPSSARARRRSKMDVIEDDGSINQWKSDDSSDDEDVKEVKPVNQNVVIEEKKAKNFRRKSKRPAPLDILDHMTMNNNVETPRSSIKEFLNIVPDQTELKFSKANLKKVEQQLKRAFIEFHHKLRLLKSFSFLNMTAFSKIMKKYDKVSSRNASKSYLEMVDNSYLGTCDEVTKLMERVEATFINHFANSNRSKGMNILRPKPRRERHRTTFSLGFFAGSAVALLLALILIIRARDILSAKGKDQYMTTMFPLYSLFGFIVLHMIMYAANIYYWRRYRVNYTFIFGFKEGTGLGHREVLLVGFALAVLALGCVHANLDMEMDPRTGDYKAFTELLPLGLVVGASRKPWFPGGASPLIQYCYTWYSSSAQYYVNKENSLLTISLLIAACICRIVLPIQRHISLKSLLLTNLFVPLYLRSSLQGKEKLMVVLPDFFLADQLTSQVQALRNLEFYVCYYGWGDYKRREDSCDTYPVFRTFLFIVTAIPYWLRLLQCLRRLYEEKDKMQGLNGLKYFLTIIAISTRTAFTLSNANHWKIIAWIASAIAVIFSTYWDLVLDWGLLQRKSKNRWLRDKLLIPHKSVYFIAIVLNVVLRFAWLQTVLNFQVSFLHRETLIAIVASLEIIRRGIWNFFRLENEHLNNVGKYRAFKSVPLPFKYNEDENEDE